MNLLNTRKLSICLASITIGAVALFGCSHGPTVQEYPDTANATEEVTKLNSEINAAIANQQEVLSPHNFKKAQESLADAQASLAKQKDEKDTLHHVAQARAYLVRSNEFATLSHANIKEVIVARHQAILAGAPNSHSKAFKEADEDLTDVTSDIEKNDLKSATESGSALQLAYLDLELQAIKQTRLGGARETIAVAIKEGAKNFAARSLAIAEKSVEDTEGYITANRHNTAELDLRSDRTRRSAEHLLKITRTSRSAKNTSSEDLALQMEGEQNKVAAKQDELDANEDQLARGLSANQALNAENSGLESEKAFNQRFEEARSQFTESEAEVYKQGNTLMIRLRGLEFPVSQAVLKGNNFPLLAKVQKVINGFSGSSIVVEGHTDSDGSKSANQKLSAARAEAVREYLLANDSGQNTNIRAIGYGYQKPLASNKTASGKAQNRRVDVLIQPNQGKESVAN